MRRRQFLVLSAASIGGVLVYSLDRKAFRLAAEGRSVRIPLRFFAQDEAMIVAAASTRIFPSDESGPGAREAGVVVYIDRQRLDPMVAIATVTRRAHSKKECLSRATRVKPTLAKPIVTA